ncbi:MAG: ester cyclase [Candidatus Poseidoniales archaeon]|nr:ester cyclase [Candidatus Poseidoniales archaeon]
MESDGVTIVRRWFEEGWNKNNSTLIEKLFSTSFRAEGGLHGIIDRLGYKQYFEAVHKASPDINCKIIELIDAGEYVVSKIISEGTHTGSVSGIEPSGEFVSSEVIDVWYIVDGKIVERRNAEFDRMGLKDQINQSVKFETE